jgi:hypothetical protein
MEDVMVVEVVDGGERQVDIFFAMALAPRLAQQHDRDMDRSTCTIADATDGGPTRAEKHAVHQFVGAYSG